MNNTDTIYKDNRNTSDNVEVVPVKLYESEGDWTEDTFEVTIFCRELISSWQTFSVVVDYFENPVYPPEEPYDCETSKSGYQCEIPDNGYWESRSPGDGYTNLWDYPAPTDDFDESDRSHYPEGVGRIFRTGKTIDKNDEIYFSFAKEQTGEDLERSLVFKNEDKTVAVVSSNGSLFLKGRLIANEPILQNDIEELPPVVSESLTSFFYIELPGEDYKVFKGPDDWLLDPIPQLTPPPPEPLEGNPDRKEWIVKNPSGDIIAILDYSTGDLKILGELKQWDDTVLGNPDIKKFIVRQSSSDDSAVFMIDESGNLYMKGILFENVL